MHNELRSTASHLGAGDPAEIVRHSGDRRNSLKPLGFLRGVPKRRDCDLEAARVIDRAITDTARTNRQVGDELGVGEKIVRLLRAGRLAFSVGRLTQVGEPLFVAIMLGLEARRAKLHAPSPRMEPVVAGALAMQRLGELQVVLALAVPELTRGQMRRDTRENITAAALQFQLAFRAFLVAVEQEPTHAGGTP